MSRCYGLFAANIFGLLEFTGDKTQDGSMTIQPGGVQRFFYRLVIHPCGVHLANIAAVHAEYKEFNS